MKYLALTLALLGMMAFSGMIIGCERQGTFEEAGEDIDEAIEDTGDAIDDWREGD
jgi:hypothetical protein